MAISFRPLPVLTIAAVIGVAVLLRLGVWQMDRLAWKNDLIAKSESRMHEVPVPLNSLLGSDEAAFNMDDIAFQPVTVKGTFDHDREIHVYSWNDERQSGFRIITPLDRSPLAPVLVDRGFVPADYKDPSSRVDGLIEGTVEITGIVKWPRQRGTYTPENELQNNIWYALEPFEQVSAYTAREDLLPLVVQAQSDPSAAYMPSGGPFPVNFRNSHLSYALTWFSLALTLVGIYFAYHVQAGRLQFQRTSDRQ